MDKRAEPDDASKQFLQCTTSMLRNRVNLTACMAVLGALLLSGLSGAAQRRSVTRVSRIWSIARGAVNNHGVVVGPNEGSIEYPAFVWRDGRRTLLESLGPVCFASSVNDREEIVGLSSLDGYLRPVLWRNGKVIDLGTVGGRSGRAKDIGNDGTAVGASHDAQDALRATAWSNGKIRDLGTLGGTNSEANGTNDLGQIVGWANTSGDAAQHAFFWNGKTMADLGTLGGANSEAHAINNRGTIVGSAQRSDGTYRACIWRNGNITELPGLGGASSVALAVNDADVVVGYARTAQGRFRATLWINGRLHVLKAPAREAVELIQATSINDLGWIVCAARKRGTSRRWIVLIKGFVPAG